MTPAARQPGEHQIAVDDERLDGASIGLDAALAILALLALASLFFTGRIPRRAARATPDAGPPVEA